MANPILITIGSVLAYFVAYPLSVWIGAEFIGKPVKNWWLTLGESATSMSVVLIITPILGFFFGTLLAMRYIIAREGEPSSIRFPTYWNIHLLSIESCGILLYGIGTWLIDSVDYNRWIEYVGLWNFRALYLIIPPVLAFSVACLVPIIITRR